MIRTSRALGALVMLVGLVAVPTTGAAADLQEQRYIVVLRDGSPAAVAGTADDLARGHGGQAEMLFTHALRGFTTTLTAAEAASMAADPRVDYVEPDRIRSIDAQTVPTGIERVFADTNADIDIDGADDFRVDVDVAVIDTGVDFEHPDLNVVGGVNCAFGGQSNTNCVAGGDDDHLHGTHVAGTIAALDNGEGVVGVAPGARIWSVKVLNRRGFGSSSWIVAGIDWVAANADTIEVANMSLGGFGFSQAEYDAIQGAVDAGVAFAVSAGNDTANAAGYSPAGFDNVLTVSALADFDGAPGALGGPFCDVDQDDTSAWYSNYGSVVDIAAPGSCILSTFPIEDGSYGTISGTSMASPHVAGALALLASADNPNNATDVQNLYQTVVGSGNLGWTDQSPDGILEPLLDVSGFVPLLLATGGSGDVDPTVSITAPDPGSIFVEGEAITFVGTASDPEDGDLTASIDWSSNLDGALGIGGSVTTTLSVGTHVVTAEVTDSGGNTSSEDVTVVVQPEGGVSIVLTAGIIFDRGRPLAHLTWTGADGTSVQVVRNSVVLRNTPNDGDFDDRLPSNPTGTTYVYQVCEIGTGICSNEASITH